MRREQRPVLLRSVALTPTREGARGMGDKTRGLYNKFSVVRMDGKSRPGAKHDGCEYFVLDLTHDPYAKPALLAYATACANEYPKLSDDLFAALSELED